MSGAFSEVENPEPCQRRPLQKNPAARAMRASLALALRWSNVLALLALIIAASFLSPYFFDLRNSMNVLRGASVLCIVAVGMTLVILSRGVDLTAGSILGMSGATWLIAATDARLAIVAALAAGAAVGLVNGVQRPGAARPTSPAPADRWKVDSRRCAAGDPECGCAWRPCPAWARHRTGACSARGRERCSREH